MQWPVPFISRVRLKNYKSIAECDVELGPLTVLVGPNGAGKSNFLDALRFVMEAVSTSPDQAITARGGLYEVLHRGSGPAGSLSAEFANAFDLKAARAGSPSFDKFWREAEKLILGS